MDQTTTQATTDDLVGIAGGLAFAAALAWISLFKQILDHVVPGEHETIWYYAMSAIFITALAYGIFYYLRKEATRRHRKASASSYRRKPKWP
jgi:hypothetical protein